MANKALFKSIFGKFIPPADAVNEAGGVAYKLSPKAALAQYAATGCLNATFYASAAGAVAEHSESLLASRSRAGVYRPRRRSFARTRAT